MASPIFDCMFPFVESHEALNAFLDEVSRHGLLADQNLIEIVKSMEIETPSTEHDAYPENDELTYKVRIQLEKTRMFEDLAFFGSQEMVNNQKLTKEQRLYLANTVIVYKGLASVADKMLPKTERGSFVAVYPKESPFIHRAPLEMGRKSISVSY